MVNLSILKEGTRNSLPISTLKNYKKVFVLGSISIVKDKIETIEVDIPYDNDVFITIGLSNVIFELSISQDSLDNFSKEEDLFIKKIKKEFFEEDEL